MKGRYEADVKGGHAKAKDYSGWAEWKLKQANMKKNEARIKQRLKGKTILEENEKSFIDLLKELEDENSSFEKED